MPLAYPRLSDQRAIELLVELTPLGLPVLANRAATDHPGADWYPTAVERVGPKQLAELQRVVRAVGTAHGYPKELPARNPRLIRFDQALAPALYECMDIIPAEAAHDGVWSFISLVLLPDVAFWRYPNRTGREDYERIIGRPRNVFRRLWWRAYALGPDVAGQLQEDEAVGIMERPSLAGNPRIARALATAHLETIAANPDVLRSELLRQVTKRLLRLTVVATLGPLTDEDLHLSLAGLFDECLRELRI